MSFQIGLGANSKSQRFNCYSYLHALALAVLLSMVGCGGSGRTEVNGRVMRKDGSPLVGARVTFRSPSTGKSAMGYSDKVGHYELGTATPGEGILPGDYEVSVIEDRGPDTKLGPRTIHAGYESAQTSKLKFTVEPGGQNTYDMELQAP